MKAKVERMWNRDKELKGTEQCREMHCCEEMKNEKGKWFFVGWYCPDSTEKYDVIATKSGMYLQQEDIRFSIYAKQIPYIDFID